MITFWELITTILVTVGIYAAIETIYIKYKNRKK